MEAPPRPTLAAALALAVVLGAANGTRAQCEASALAIPPVPDADAGLSTAVSGRWIAVGARGDTTGGPTGSVHLFRAGAGGFPLVDTVGAPVGSTEQDFGQTLDLVGDTLVVGAGANSSDRSATVFRFDGGHWTYEDTVVVSSIDSPRPPIAIDTRDEDRFAVGYEALDTVYVHHRVGDRWELEASITEGFGGGAKRFGTSVALSGRILAVGQVDDEPGGHEAGAVHLYRREAGAWSRVALLTPSDGQAGDEFGNAIALSSGVLAVSAPFHRSPEGAVYVFERGAGGWHQTQTLSPGPVAAFFGLRALALQRNTLAVGAPATLDTTGAVHRYVRSGGQWVERSTIQPDDSLTGAFFGQGLSMDDGLLVVGAFNADDGAPSSGAAFAIDCGDVDALPPLPWLRR